METKGIDVSSYHGKIDWKKVKEDGIDFAIIRAGWGKVDVDRKFRTNIEEAINAGIEVGIYWVLYAKNENDIILNAKKCQETIEPYRRKITMRVWADWEYDSDKYNPRLTKAQRTAFVKKFLEEMENYGFSVGVYLKSDYLKSKFNDMSKYPLWIAYYATSKGIYNPFLWQHSNNGRVDGIIPKVDLNICYGKIGKKPSAMPKKIYATVKLGSAKEEVKLLQSILKQYGYDCGAIDGNFGPTTHRAVIRFQEDRGLEATGIVENNTWGELTK